MTITRILVVEDEQIISKAIEKRLKRLGYAVAGVAYSGEDAVEKAVELHPDLILMDINLGSGIDGVETAGLIRLRMNVPVVFLTAHSDEATLQRAKITEPHGYILKPYEDSDLRTAIEIGVYKHRMDRRLDDYRHELEDANARLELLATTDVLTGLKNRRAFQDRLTEEVKRASRIPLPLSLMLLDVDHFKQFNDAFGHPAGDVVLKVVARLLGQSTRSTDFVARYGGEEFAVLLPNTDQTGADVTAERVRRAVAEADWRERAVTVSVGVATMDAAIDRESALVAAADAALYRSKRSGRNCVCNANDKYSSSPSTAQPPEGPQP